MAIPRLAPLALLATFLLAAAPALDQGEFRRGALAVADRTSEQPALRERPQSSASFRLGAVFRAWRNSEAAVRFDSSNTTGDGGDAEALAIDCADERIAFATLEASRLAIGISETEVARVADDGDPGIVSNWRTRRSVAPAACH